MGMTDATPDATPDATDATPDATPRAALDAAPPPHAVSNLLDLHDDMLTLVLTMLDLTTLQSCKRACRRLIHSVRHVISTADWWSAMDTATGFAANVHDHRMSLWRANALTCVQLTGGTRTRILLILDCDEPLETELAAQLQGMGARPRRLADDTTPWCIQLVGPIGLQHQLHRDDQVLAPFVQYLREPLLEGAIIDEIVVPATRGGGAALHVTALATAPDGTLRVFATVDGTGCGVWTIDERAVEAPVEEEAEQEEAEQEEEHEERVFPMGSSRRYVPCHVSNWGGPTTQIRAGGHAGGALAMRRDVVGRRGLAILAPRLSPVLLAYREAPTSEAGGAAARAPYAVHEPIGRYELDSLFVLATAFANAHTLVLAGTRNSAQFRFELVLLFFHVDEEASPWLTRVHEEIQRDEDAEAAGGAAGGAGGAAAGGGAAGQQPLTFTCLAAADGFVVAGRSDGASLVWRVEGSGVTTRVERVCPARPGGPPLMEHTDSVYACATSHGLHATGSDDGTVRLWDPVAFPAAAAGSQVAPAAPAGEVASGSGPGGAAARVRSLVAIKARGKVWAMAMHQNMLVCGGGGYINGSGGVAAGAAHGRRFAVEVFDVQGVRRFAGQVRELWERASRVALGDAALAEQILDRMQSGLAERVAVLSPHTGSDPWGVRSLYTDGHAVVASGDDGYVRVWLTRRPQTKRSARDGVTMPMADAGTQTQTSSAATTTAAGTSSARADDESMEDRDDERDVSDV